jgi:DNA-binding XRE family transcriptional regulator
MKLLPEHIGGARGMLKMSQAELAAEAGISARTIINFENGVSELRPETELALIAVLERRGIRFANGGQPTVTLLEPRKG